jgi:plastocyanin
MTVAAFVSSRRSVTGATLGSFVGAAAGIAMAAGGIAIVVIGPPEEEIPPFHAELAAPEGAIQAGFSADALTFEPGAPIELEFDNEDPGVGHNVQIFDGPDDTAPSLFDGEPITGPATTTYAIAPLTPGEYFFHCRLHPGTAMEGTITVQEGAGAVRVVAKDTAFDTDEIHLPADTPSAIAVDNEDPFAHNLSIYEDDTASGVPLFTFEPFSGPETKTFDVEALAEGEYYFRCDIHTNMNGTVVVAPAPPPGEGGPGEPGGDDGGGGG